MNEEEPWRQPEWYRIIGDFNNDELADIAISTSTSIFGNAGGWFSVYLRTPSDKLKYIGEIFAHPYAINIKSVSPGKTLITTYHHNNVSSGMLVNHQLSNDEIVELSRAQLFPGTSEADKKEYDSLFEKSSNLIIEKSNCKEKIISWIKYR